MSDPAPFFAMIFLFFYESKWFKSIKNAKYGVTRKCGLIFRFIDGLITINDGNEFENHYKEIYPPQVILKEESTSHTVYFSKTSFERFIQFQCCDTFPCKSSTIPLKMFFATIRGEIPQIF